MYDLTIKEVSEINETNYFKVQDYCRRGLIQYLHKTLSYIPPLKNPLMLHMGCNTGIQSIELVKILGGVVYSIDKERKCIDFLKQKICDDPFLIDQIIPFNRDPQKIDFQNFSFDLILADGLSNMMSFEEGLKQAINLINNSGYFIIHDERINLNEKIQLIDKYKFRVINIFELDSSIWWYDYYARWEKAINKLGLDDEWGLFDKILEEVDMFKIDPSHFTSYYFVLQKT